MAEKPKLLRIVTDMRSKGLSDDEIESNLSQMGLSDEEVEEVMEIAEKDVYAKFKGEMSQFIQKRIKDNRDMIDSMVEDKLEEEMEEVEDQVYSRAEKKMGGFAKKMNEKIDNLSLSTKKVREENVELRKKVELLRTDVNNLLSGPSKLRLILAVVFFIFGLFLAGHAVFNVTPQVMALDFGSMTEGVILMVTGAMYLLTSVVFVTVGVYFTGEPGG